MEPFTPLYFAGVPKEVPQGRIVVHNHVKAQSQLGQNGFRVWSDLLRPRYVECTCGWAPHLGGLDEVRPQAFRPEL